jgi:hypothetical protein
VDVALIRLLGNNSESEPAVIESEAPTQTSNREGTDAILWLVAALDKQNADLSIDVSRAATSAAVSDFGDLNRPLQSVKL